MAAREGEVQCIHQQYRHLVYKAKATAIRFQCCVLPPFHLECAETCHGCRTNPDRLNPSNNGSSLSLPAANVRFKF